MSIGMRAHDIQAKNITDLAEKLEQLDIHTIQLALLKSIRDIDLSEGSFSPGLARFIREELEKHDIHVSVLGCYINPVHPDPAERAQQLTRFREHIKYAKYIGADMIGTETGSVNFDWSFNPNNHSEENYQDFLSVMRPLAQYAASLGVMLGIEGVFIHTLYSPERMKRFLDDIDMPNVSVIFDPVNYLNENNYHDQHKIIAQAFELFGDRIAAVHIKDFIVKGNTLQFALPTEGELDLPFLMKLIKSNKPHIDLLLEGVPQQEVVRIREKLLTM